MSTDMAIFLGLILKSETLPLSEVEQKLLDYYVHQLERLM